MTGIAASATSGGAASATSGSAASATSGGAASATSGSAASATPRTTDPASPATGEPAGGAGTRNRARRRRSGAFDSDSASRTLISAADLSRPRNRRLYWLVLAALFVLFLLVFFFPLYWMITGAVKSPVEFAQPVPTLLPHSWHPGTYATAWTRLQIAHFFLNTLGYAVGGWLVQLAVDVPVAYALAKLRPVFGRVVLALMLASLMLPAAALLVPTYLTVSNVPLLHLNLLNTPWALWLPGAANAFNIYVLKRFFDQIPGDLLDSAAIDGAGRIRVLWSIVLPLSRPVLAVISIFAVVGIWKDFLWPMLVLQRTETQTLSVALHRLSATSQVPPTEMMAGLVIASVPMLAIFLVFQRHILRGLSAGAIKG